MNKNATAILILLTIVGVHSYDGMTIKDLSKETVDELRLMLSYKNVVANCTNHPRPPKPQFLLYNKLNSQNPITISSSNINEIKKEKKTFFVIPGWLTRPNNSVILSLKDAYLQRYDCNIIIVDWSKNAFMPYSYLYCEVRSASMDVADFACALNQELDIELKDVHVIGHSFGGHLAGFVSEYTDLECNEKIGRVTALDAAGPLYKYRPENERISEKDALFVDVIHSDEKLGILENCGEVDFHVNCVRDQGACNLIKNLTDDTLLSDVYCPSVLSIELFTESINSNQLIGVSCGLCSRYCSPDIITEVYTIMGEDCREKPGSSYTDNFLIYTSDTKPYGLGMSPYP